MDEVLALNQQIAELEKKRVELEKKNRPMILADMRAKMEAYKITAQELTAPPPKAKKVKIEKPETDKPARTEKKKKPESSIPVKYKGPQGETWTGRGMKPKWLVALLATGREKEEFLVTEAPVGGAAVSEAA